MSQPTRFAAVDLIRFGTALLEAGDPAPLSTVREHYNPLVTMLAELPIPTIAAVNGSAGTDHGSAHAMIVMGGGVRGGRIYGAWPGLASAQLYQGRDLAVAVDFRDVFAELARVQLGVSDTAALFPGFTPGAPLGLVA